MVKKGKRGGKSISKFSSFCSIIESNLTRLLWRMGIPKSSIRDSPYLVYCEIRQKSEQKKKRAKERAWWGKAKRLKDGKKGGWVVRWHPLKDGAVWQFCAPGNENVLWQLYENVYGGEKIVVYCEKCVTDALHDTTCNLFYKILFKWI